MSFDLTILKAKIEKIKAAYDSGKFGDALLSAVNTGNGLMQQRIFTTNQDIEGNSFGQYVGKKRKVRTLPKTKNRTQAKRNKAVEGQELTYWQRKRALKGRQITKKDLEFEGGLRRAIETKIQDEKSAVIEFNNDDAVKIAKGQEAQITNIRNGRPGTTKGNGIRIFTLDEKEREQVGEQGSELLKQILQGK